ncbi:MAG TPA: hypothetical protein VL118_05660, partial [Luteimonas sp.]|nr:hypothetical protein [Luteimonas sp.]
RAEQRMTEGGSLLTLTYYGAEKWIPHYNVMGWRAADPIGFETLSDILDEASVRWARDRIPFWALLPTRGAPPAGT